LLGRLKFSAGLAIFGCRSNKALLPHVLLHQPYFMKSHKLSSFVLSVGLSGLMLLISCKKDNNSNSNANNNAISATWTLKQGTLFYDNSQYGRANEYDTVNFLAPHQDTLIFTQDGRVIDITYIISYIGATPADNRYNRFSDTITYKFSNDSTLKFNGFTPTISYIDTAPTVTVLKLSASNLTFRNRTDTTDASSQTLFFTK